MIIPSAKLVPEELWNLGKLPGIIYPINQRIVFDYLFQHRHYMLRRSGEGATAA